MKKSIFNNNMSLSNILLKHIAHQLSVETNTDITINAHSFVSGGSINAAYGLQTNAGNFMMKLNSKSAYPNMFKREVEGLNAIRNTQTIAVPEVILQVDFEDDSCLIIEWIDLVRATPNTSRLLGSQLAAMHKNTATKFGFDSDNYMGSLLQSNRKHNTWSTFFMEERLQPMVQLALSKGLLTIEDEHRFNKLYSRLPELFVEEPPALIHGDLWGGNYLISATGKPYLIDPAVSYGYREFDIAMTTLFGGFGREFYEAYQEAFPLANDWHTRIDLWNLYPLLLHLNLFGTSYLGQVRGALKQFV